MVQVACDEGTAFPDREFFSFLWSCLCFPCFRRVCVSSVGKAVAFPPQDSTILEVFFNFIDSVILWSVLQGLNKKKMAP